MFDVLGIGVAAVDDLVRVPRFPAPDTKVQVTATERTCGGLSATALVAAARLGASCAYAGVLGTDELSDHVLACLEADGIDTSHVARRAEAGPGHSIVVIDDAGTRTVFSDRRRATLGGDDWPPEAVVRSTGALVVDHVRIGASTRAASIARAAAVPVVADLERDDDPRFPGLLALVDHLVIPRALAERLAGTGDPSGMLRALRAPGRTTVVTCGAEGAWYLGPRPNDRPDHEPALPVEVVDTTGCGDAFHGAYAATLAFGIELPARIRVANVVAGLSATRLGGQAGIPARREVEALLGVPLRDVGAPSAGDDRRDMPDPRRDAV